jgi:hypothetical protein
MNLRTTALTGLLVISAPCSAPTAQVPDPQEAAIRAARDKWNSAVAKRDPAALRELLSDSFHGVGGAGHIPSRDALLALATKRFAERPDLFYENRPTRIRVVADFELASEYGEWLERWKEPTGLTEMRGTYYVLWRRVEGRWVIEGVVEMPESCIGSDYCKPR